MTLLWLVVRRWVSRTSAAGGSFGCSTARRLGRKLRAPHLPPSSLGRHALQLRPPSKWTTLRLRAASLRVATSDQQALRARSKATPRRAFRYYAAARNSAAAAGYRSSAARAADGTSPPPSVLPPFRDGLSDLIPFL